MHSIAEALARQGHDVHALVPYHPDIRPHAGPVKVHPFRYVWPDKWAIMGHAQAMDSDRRLRKAALVLSPFFFLSGVQKLRQLTRQYQFDIIHAHWVIPNGPIGALVAHRRRIPLLITLHGSDIFVARKNPLLGRMARISFNQAAAVTACSPQLQEGALALGAPAGQTHLIKWGADPAYFDAGRFPASNELKAKLNLAGDGIVVMSLGRLVKKKGIEHLVKAAPAIVQEHPQTTFIIAGDGPERESLAALAQAAGVQESFRFVGNIPWQEVPRYLRLADIFVVPSVEDEAGNLDGLPTTIPEAMAAGKPVVASRVAGIPLVVHHQQTGLLVEQRQPEELAAAIGRLIADPERRLAMGRAARQLVVEELNWDEVARAFTALYQSARSRAK